MRLEKLGKFKSSLSATSIKYLHQHHDSDCSQIGLNLDLNFIKVKTKFPSILFEG